MKRRVFPALLGGVWRDDLVKTSLSGKDKAHVWDAAAGFVPGFGAPSPRMSFAENDQAHKGF